MRFLALIQPVRQERVVSSSSSAVGNGPSILTHSFLQSLTTHDSFDRFAPKQRCTRSGGLAAVSSGLS